MLKHFQPHAILQWTVNSANLESSGLPGSTIVSGDAGGSSGLSSRLGESIIYYHGLCCKFHWSVSTFLLELATFDGCGLISV